jgi:hypothetical protein
MDDFDRELECLEDAISKDEEMHAIKRQFEESELWHEHRKFHMENGGHAQLLVHEVPVEEQQSSVKVPVFVEHEVQHRKTIKVGGCECNPTLAFMQQDDRGRIIAGIPAPVEVGQTYGSAPESTATYGAAQGPSESVYLGGNQQNKELYR